MTTFTLLCIDDDPGIARLLKDGLGSQGFVVLTASSVLEALSILRKVEIDLIILDVVLPDVDGFGFIDLLATEPRNNDVPIIVATGCASEETRLLALQKGAFGFIRKPFQLKEVVTLAKRAIRHRLRPLTAEA